jgi:flagellar basal-body rod protein FlgB
MRIADPRIGEEHSVWIERLTQTRTRHAVELSARFAEARHRVLAENIANIDTPDYQTRRLDSGKFQTTLQAALARGADSNAVELRLAGERQVQTGADGRLQTQPELEPPENVLFHDGTNARLESLVSDVSQNSLWYSLSLNLLRGSFERVTTAIRGRTS